MPAPEPFVIFTRKLTDLVVLLKNSDLPRIAAAFPPDEFYCPPLDVMRIEISRTQRGHFNLIHHETGFKADIYPCCDELHRWGLQQAQTIDFDGTPITLAPPEYVIIRKLQFFREGGSRKHLRDINRILASREDQWAAGKIEEMIRVHGLDKEWDQAVHFSE